MFRFFLVLGLVTGVIALDLRAHRRLDELVLVDLAPGASVVLHRAWAVLVELWPASGILAAAVILFAAAVALGLLRIHAGVVLDRKRQRLDRTYRDDELDAARRGRAKIERALASTNQRLQAARRDLAA